jgi:hypothetical protein
MDPGEWHARVIYPAESKPITGLPDGVRAAYDARWAELVSDEELRGHIFIQQGMDSGFVAEPCEGDKTPRSSRRRARGRFR